MSQRVFITGATGYVGSAIAARFARAGFDVYGLTRTVEGARALSALNVKPVVGNLSEPDSYIGDLKNSDIVIHAAADYGQHAAQDQLALEAVRAAAEDGRVRRFLYTSGVWDYGRVNDRAVDESLPLAPLPLVAWRVAHHDVAFDLAEFEVNVTVLQPANVYGESRGLLARWWGEARQHKTVTMPGAGEQIWGLVHRDDLADAYALACEHAPHGERYLLADGTAFTVREIAEAIARVTGATVKSQPASEVLAKLGPYGEALLASVRINAGKAHRELGWVPRHASFANEADDLYREFQSGLSTPVA